MFTFEIAPNNFGVAVLGTAVIRVPPDVVEIRFSVSRVEKNPKEAFQKVRYHAQKVRRFLDQNTYLDVGSSQMTLADVNRHVSGTIQFVGYQAQLDFMVMLHELDQLEKLLTGVVDTGVNKISSVEFQTTRLKELRMKARQQAVEAAREKAEVYCAAGGMTLGNIIRIEEASSHHLSGDKQNVHWEEVESDRPFTAFDPASIFVGAGVRVMFDIS